MYFNRIGQITRTVNGLRHSDYVIALQLAARSKVHTADNLTAQLIIHRPYR